MAPEFKIPCLVQCVDGFVLLFQPYAESFLAVLAVAFSTVFVADVPADYMRIGSVACGQLIDKGGSVFLKNKGIRAGIVAVSEFMMTSLIVRSCDLRIFFEHPCRHCACGSGKHDVIALFAEHIDDVIKLGKIVFVLGRLKLRPGKDIYGGAVDACVTENPHVLAPDLASPLIRVVVPAV